VCVLAIAALALLPATVVRADTASDLAAARQTLAAAQAEARAAAEDLSRAEGRHAELQRQVDELGTSIVQTKAQIDVLRVQVRDRAVGAYIRGGAGSSEFEALLSTDGPIAAARREHFLEQANQADNRVIDDLAILEADLDAQQQRLKHEREAQQVIREQLTAKSIAVQETLAAASRAQDELAARLEREQAAAAAAEAARIRAAQAASRPQARTSPANAGGGGGAGQIIANPGGGSFQCPVSGSAYSDNYGPRGSGFHYGMDMFAATGVPLVAAKSGTVSYMAMNGAGGNEAYLAANDGNVYYYAHMSQFVGGSRTVSQGEVIGLVGSTGNSTAPHLHFEIRVGGANGARVNPYPTLSGAGC
jgi:murein DD-endopeptidase MepM/ murein hydrolase activator NlpD